MKGLVTFLKHLPYLSETNAGVEEMRNKKFYLPGFTGNLSNARNKAYKSKCGRDVEIGEMFQ